MQRSRRTNPYPMTWEIPLAATLAVAMALLLGVHAGRAVANLLAGNPWRFTPRDELLTSLPGLLGGDGAAGMTQLPHPATAAALRAWIQIVELLVVAVIAFAGKYALDRWGPGRIHGMASKGEAERLLGLTRLRKVAALVRPDLHGTPEQGRRR